MAPKQAQKVEQTRHKKDVEQAKPKDPAARDSQQGAAQTSMFEPEGTASAPGKNAPEKREHEDRLKIEKDTSPEGKAKTHSKRHDVSKEPEPAPDKKRKKVVLPSAHTAATRIPLASQRTAPASGQAQGAELATIRATPLERQYSTGFILGIAIVAVSLIAGIFIARLHKKTNRLESRLDRLERVISDSPFFRGN